MLKSETSKEKWYVLWEKRYVFWEKWYVFWEKRTGVMSEPIRNIHA
jgi:hypothetical protein